MNLTQYLIIEICPECPLGEKHTWCPNRHPDRWKNSIGQRPLSDRQILQLVHDMICVYGFQGMIGFHYYNEPLFAWPRVRQLIAQIKADTPLAQFVLWTNCELLPADLDELKVFDQLNVTNYAGRSLNELQRRVKNVIVRPVAPDTRTTVAPAETLKACRRMFCEIIFDYYGNVHPCCYDWRGEVPVGNIHDDTLATIVERWHAIRESVAGHEMGDTAPAACRRCALRSAAMPNLNPAVSRIAAEYLELGTKPAVVNAVAPSKRESKPYPPQPFIVVVAYRIPEHRVRHFFEWNDAIFREHGIRVIVVVETQYTGLPEYALQLPFVEKMDVFCLARCKNFGLGVALAAGASPLIIADIDLVFPPALMVKMLAVGEHEMVVPCYYMASDYEHRETLFVKAPLATGTLAMRGDGWRVIRYDERCTGYGMEDGVILQDTCQAGYRLTHRNDPIYHIAHVAGTPQKEFAGRSDHWGRDTGFNPPRFNENRKNLR